MAAASPQVSRITGGNPLRVAKHGCIMGTTTRHASHPTPAAPRLDART